MYVDSHGVCFIPAMAFFFKNMFYFSSVYLSMNRMRLPIIKQVYTRFTIVAITEQQSTVSNLVW